MTPSPAAPPVRASRRKVLATGAWAAPAIVVASAVPAMASSVGTITFVDSAGNAANRRGYVDVALSPAPSSSPTPAVAYDDQGAATVDVTLRGTSAGVATYRLRFTTSDPSPASVAVTITVPGYAGSVSTTVTMGAAGLVDASFADPQFDGTTQNLATTTSGSIYVTGFFSSVGGTPRRGLARLGLDGAVDASFDAQLDEAAFDVAVQDDGKVLAGGRFTSARGTQRDRLARFNADGTVDLTFADPGINGEVGQVKVLPDGKILVTGDFSSVGPGGTPRPGYARFLSDGTLDTSFVVPDMSRLGAVAVVPGATAGDYELVVDAVISGTQRLARLTSDGAVKPGFNPDVVGYQGGTGVSCIVAQPDGRLLVSGAVSSVAGVPRGRVARLNADGSLDTTFADPDIDGVVCITIALQGTKVLITGWDSSRAGGRPFTRLGRLNADGTGDETFQNPDVQGGRYTFGVGIQPVNGGILVSGEFTQVSGAQRLRFARVLS